MLAFRFSDPKRPSRVLLPLAITAMAAAFALNVYSQDKPLAQQDRRDAIHFGDIVDVDVEGSLEYDWRGKLDPEGFLDGLNSFGDPIKGLCREPAEIAADYEKALAATLRSPKVVVRLIDTSGRPTGILDGAVRTPFRFLIKRDVHLSELLALSGGITDASGGTISIFRPPANTCPSAGVKETDAGMRTLIKISDLVKGSAAADPLIVSGDLIVVEKAEPVYVIGGVEDPRPIPLRGTLMLSRLIAMAGGLAKDADGGQITVFRHKGERIAADLAAIESGAAKDVELKALDIVDVPRKGSKKRESAPVVESAQTPASAQPPLRVLD